MQTLQRTRQPTPEKPPAATDGTKVGNGSGSNARSVETVNSQRVACPVCGSEIRRDALPDGIDEAGMLLLHGHAHDGTLVQMLELAEIVSRNLDPSRMGAEIQVKDFAAKLSQTAAAILEKQVEFLKSATKEEKEDKAALLESALKEQQNIIRQYQDELKRVQEQQLRQVESFNGAISDIKEKLVGTAIGKVAEVMTVKELKSAFPQDSFSNAKAAKGLADIVAVVKEKGAEAGKVIISVKNEVRWNDEFLEQLRRNLEDEGAKWGILVTKVFPAEALNDKMTLTQEGFFLVKSEYAPIAYQAARQAAIHWHDAQRWVKDKEEQLRLSEKLTEVIRAWIRGDNFGQVMRSIDTAVNESRQTDDLLVQLNRYAARKIAEMRRVQSELRESLMKSSDILGELKQDLESPDVRTSIAQRRKD